MACAAIVAATALAGATASRDVGRRRRAHPARTGARHDRRRATRRASRQCARALRRHLLRRGRQARAPRRRSMPCALRQIALDEAPPQGARHGAARGACDPCRRRGAARRRTGDRAAAVGVAGRLAARRVPIGRSSRFGRPGTARRDVEESGGPRQRQRVRCCRRRAPSSVRPGRDAAAPASRRASSEAAGHRDEVLQKADKRAAAASGRPRRCRFRRTSSRRRERGALEGQPSGSTRTSASDRLSPDPRARWRALPTSISVASRGGSACTIAPSSRGVK